MYSNLKLDINLNPEYRLERANKKRKDADIALQNGTAAANNTSNRTRVILLRHGQSNYNAMGLYQGSSDRPNLTALGRQQAQETARFLQGVKFDAIYSSPLKRAQETAKEIVKAISPTAEPPIHLVSQLQETQLPLWEGLAFTFVKQQFEQDYHCWKQRPHEFRMKTEETDFSPTQELYNRVEQFWQQILPQHPSQTILIVSHGGTNRALLSTALGVSPARYHCIEQSNCAVNILSFANESSNSVEIEAINHIGYQDCKIPPLPSTQGLRLLLVPTANQLDPTMQNLALLLKDATIDFSISDRQESSLAISDLILQHHPQAVSLQVEREDFLWLWQKDISSQNTEIAGKSITGLVIASDRAIQHFLACALDLKPEQLSSFKLYPGCVSILHYSSLLQPPLIQGINIS